MPALPFVIAAPTLEAVSSVDHVAAALSRIPSQFQKPKFQKLIRAFTYHANELEQVMWAVLTQRSILNAVGAQLDVIGNIVGQDRNGLSDDDYRRFVLARVAADRSHGNIEELYRIAELVLNDTTVTMALNEEGLTTIRLTLFGAVTDNNAQILFTFLRVAIAGGVRILLEWSNEILAQTFQLDAGPGLDIGYLASVLG